MHPRNRTTHASRVAISWLLLSLALLGCSNGFNPLDPGGQEPPPGQGPPPGSDPPIGPDPPVQPPPAVAVPLGLLTLSVTGSEVVVATGYRVIVQLEGELEPRTRLAHSEPFWWSLPPGTHTVRIEPVLDYCVVEGSGRPFSIVERQNTPVELPASCTAAYDFAAGSYERRLEAGSIPGSLSERFELQADGSFRLVYQISPSHSLVYDGEFYLTGESPEERELRLLFAPNGTRQNATATLRGDCLVVEYNLIMALSDFANGTFCRS